MEKRYYEIIGRKEDLDTIEKAVRHCEYLGNIGASRNILLRVDGDGSGRIKVFKLDESTVLDENKKPIDNDKYNIEQNLGQGATVGVYDIG